MPDCSTIIGSIAINKVKDTPRPGGLSSMRLHRGAHEPSKASASSGIRDSKTRLRGDVKQSKLIIAYWLRIDANRSYQIPETGEFIVPVFFHPTAIRLVSIDGIRSRHG